MELRLQKFISSMGTLSDVRNLDPFNPIILLMEHPVTAIQYTIIVSIVEPSYMGIPINCIWVCMDSTKRSYKKALKLKAIDPSTYSGEAELVDGYKQAWTTLSKYDEVFSDPQYYDNGSGGGVAGEKGEKGDKGDKGDTGPMGPAGPAPTLDYAAIAIEVAKILGNTAPAEKTLSIEGAATILEGGNSTYTVNLINGTDVTPIVVQITATANGAFVTIDAANKVTAKAVTADTDVELTASYVSNGQTLTVKKIIKLINAALNSISASGLAATIFEGKTAQLAVTAAYSNSTSSAVTAQCTYEVVPPAAGSVSASGLFTAASVAADTPFLINISYAENGVTKTAAINSIAKNIVVSTLTISGATSVNEGANAQYTASAAKNDASPAANVTAAWSVAPTSAGTFDANGLFSAGLVAADTPAVITASYTLEGVTVTDTHNITVKNVAALLTPYYGVASTSATKDANLILSLSGRGPNADRKMNPCTMTAGVNESYYYAYPVAYGLASFIDLSNGFEGGMDGASGDRGQTLGPITVNVMVNGVSTPFYLYASDQSNLGKTDWNVV